MFDNEAVRPSLRRRSRALLLRLDEQHRRVRLVRSYSLPTPVLSTSQGNAQLLPDGHVLVGWGSNPRVTEFGRQGRILLDLTFGGGAANSYRAFRFPWTGHPTDAPAMAVVRAGKRAIVYASWNGATEVAAWRVLAGPDGGHLRTVAQARKTGFETAIPVSTRARAFRVAALERRRRVMRLSRAAPG